MCFSFRTLAAVCTVAVSLNTGCAVRDDISPSDSTGSLPLFSVEKEDSAAAFITPEVPEPQYFEPASDADCTITFAEDCIGIRGEGAAVDGNAAVITAGGVYRISGECSDGRLMICSEDAVSLILNGVDICSEDGTAVENTGTGELTLSLSEGKQNRIGCGGQSSGIRSSSDITINGSGSLVVESGEIAISSDGAIRLCGGELSISSKGDGIVSGSHIIAAGANTSIISGADGMKVTYTGADSSGYVSMTDGALDIISATDGIQAENAVFISGGSVSLSCGGGSSAVVYNDIGGRYLRGRHGGYTAGGETEFDFGDLVSGDGSSVSSKKGIRSGGCIAISGGEVEITSADDSLYAKSDIIFRQGAVTLSSGDDGVHSDDGIIILGGELAVENSYNSIEGMMVEIRGGDIRLNSRRGGIVAAGGTQLASSSADSTDRYVSISGGSVSLNSGGSGINSGGAATVSGGSLTVYSGNDDIFGSVDHRDYFALSGGIFAAFGSDGATKAPNVLSSPCISILADIREGSIVEIMDSAGKLLFSTVVPRASSTVLFSSEELVSGEEYFVYADSVLQKTIVASEGVSGDGPSGRVTGIFDGFDIVISDPYENIA